MPASECVGAARGAAASSAAPWEVGPGPVLRLGVVSDIQYCDIDDRMSFAGTQRYYRNTLALLAKAKDSWNREAVDLVVHCGDVIDGTNRNQSTVDEAIATVSGILDAVRAPVHHVLGNHCVYCMPRDKLKRILNMRTPHAEVGYYAITPCASWRLLVMDSSDVAKYGRSPDHPHTKKAVEILDQMNPNQEKNDPSGLVGTSRRFVSFGGGIGDEQAAWLRCQLGEAETQGQNVIVCCHIPLIEGLHFPTCLVWNYQEILAILHDFSCVKLCMYGHTHKRAHLQDSKGIHHIVLHGMVESPPGGMGHGVLELFNDRIVLKGFGAEKSQIMSI